MVLYSGLELFDVFSSTFAKCCLRLTVSLFAFFRGRIDLCDRVSDRGSRRIGKKLTGFLPPLRLGAGAGSCVACSKPSTAASSGSGVEAEEEVYLSILDSRFGTTASGSVTSAFATEPMPAPRDGV